MMADSSRSLGIPIKKDRISITETGMRNAI